MEDRATIDLTRLDPVTRLARGYESSADPVLRPYQLATVDVVRERYRAGDRGIDGRAMTFEMATAVIGRALNRFKAQTSTTRGA